MFLIIGAVFLVLLSATLMMLWIHERITTKREAPHAKIEEYWNGEERRLHKRFNNELEVEYSVEKGPHIKNGRTVNMSKGGMKLLIDEKLPKGTMLDMKVHIPEKKRTVELDAEVVWTNDADKKDISGRRFFFSGLKFIAIKEPSGIHFFEYLAHLESKE